MEVAVASYCFLAPLVLAGTTGTSNSLRMVSVGERERENIPDSWLLEMGREIFERTESDVKVLYQESTEGSGGGLGGGSLPVLFSWFLYRLSCRWYSSEA